jgi:hypothetical protein
MRKLLRLGVAAMLAATGLIVTAGTSSAEPVVVQDCDDKIHTDRVNIPGQEVDDLSEQDIPLTGDGVLAEEDSCAELLRTIVFVGTASITNGVNFAGNGTHQDDTLGTRTHDNGTPLDTSDDYPIYGNDYVYEGTCVLVDWENVDVQATGCGFSEGTTFGTYGGPTTGANGLFNPIGAGLEPESPGYTGLDWAPNDQASCTNSSGEGVSDFIASGTGETWSSEYTWNESLSNLRGSIWNAADPGTVYPFDAKIEAQADPRGALADENANAFDFSAVGCLEKTLVNLPNGQTGSQDTNSDEFTGLNSILIVGTATWHSVVPELLFP